ncbi:MAG: hypothetical protein CTY39_11630 [Hyphomicrobium sp.]|nr:MAG: hypothetical protein CTY39_11630 [Hyphomicrobium sp.]
MLVVIIGTSQLYTQAQSRSMAGQHRHARQGNDGSEDFACRLRSNLCHVMSPGAVDAFQCLSHQEYLRFASTAVPSGTDVDKVKGGLKSLMHRA